MLWNGDLTQTVQWIDIVKIICMRYLIKIALSRTMKNINKEMKEEEIIFFTQLHA